MRCGGLSSLWIMVCRASLRARDRCDLAFGDQRGGLRRLPVELGRGSSSRGGGGEVDAGDALGRAVQLDVRVKTLPASRCATIPFPVANANITPPPTASAAAECRSPASYRKSVPLRLGSRAAPAFEETSRTWQRWPGSRSSRLVRLARDVAMLGLAWLPPLRRGGQGPAAQLALPR